MSKKYYYKNITFLVSILLVIFFFNLFAFVKAEACMGYFPTEEINSSDIIFIGRLVEIKNTNTTHKFVPYKVWKSNFDKQTIEVKSINTDGGNNKGQTKIFNYLSPCSMQKDTKYPFLSDPKIGQEYLIFAKKSGDNFVIDSTYSNSLPLDFRIKDKNEKLIAEIENSYQGKYLAQNFNLYEKTDNQKYLEYFILITILTLLIFVIFFWYWKMKKKKV